MSVLSRLLDPTNWINRITFVFALFMLVCAALWTIAMMWWSSLSPVAGTLIMTSLWCLLFGIVILDERRQPNGSVMATGVLPTRQTPTMIMHGTLWAVAMLAPIAAGGIILGGEFKPAPFVAQPFMLVSIIVASVGEELLFRSTLLRVLGSRFGSGWSVMVTSILFSVAHTANPFASMISSVNTFLIAVAFGTVIAMGGSIWVAAACHAAWNVLVALFFGAVSGQDGGASWLHYVPSDGSTLSPLLMGDAYGIESGLLCTAVITISLVVIRRIAIVDPFVAAARYRVDLKNGQIHLNPITVMESSNDA